MKTFTIIRKSLSITLLLPALLLFALSCGGEQLSETSAQNNYLIGTYKTYEIIDGDTFRVPELVRGIRFLGIDTEETPKGEDADGIIEGITPQWPDAYDDRRGGSEYPVKAWSPFGYQTAQWAVQWFSDVDSVRLERDAEGEVFGYFGRYLAYVIAFKHGEEINYNIECVRLGYSPYFTKYGFSRRFHDQFTAAQEEAMNALRGIWDPSLLHYPDYGERLEWWNARGEAIREYEKLFSDNESYFFIGWDGELERFELANGDDVVIFGIPGRMTGHGFPYTMEIAHKRDRSLNILFTQEAATAYEIASDNRDEQLYMYFAGTADMGEGKATLVIDREGSVSTQPPVAE